MPTSQRGRAPSWETQATRDLMMDEGCKLTFCDYRHIKSLLKDLEIYSRMKCVEVNYNNRIILSLAILYHAGDSHREKPLSHQGEVGGFSMDFLVFAKDRVVHGSEIRCLLERAITSAARLR